jgi:hypothetical protein
MLNSSSTNWSTQAAARVQPAAAPCHAVFNYFTGMYELLVLDINQLNTTTATAVGTPPSYFLYISVFSVIVTGRRITFPMKIQVFATATVVTGRQLLMF